MPINAHPDYLAAEKEYLLAQTLEEKIRATEKMLSAMPRHKGAENLRAQIRSRYKKLKEQLTKSKKSGSSKRGIKKETMQAVIVGKTNSGKSTLLTALTNARPKISETLFTTTEPVIGMLNYATANMQLIENPAIESEYYDKGLANTADTILILVNKIEDIKFIEQQLANSKAKKIIVFNNKNNLDERKISETLRSKRYNFVIINSGKLKSAGSDNFHNVTRVRWAGVQGFTGSPQELKEKLLLSFNKIRIYTKEPNQKQKSQKPIVLKPGATIYDVAEKILHGFSKNIKETKIWGPSSKFPGQKVGLQHQLKDLDVVEFKTR